MDASMRISDELWERLSKDKKRGETFDNKISNLQDLKESLERLIRNSGRTNIIQIDKLKKILENASYKEEQISLSG